MTARYLTVKEVTKLYGIGRTTLWRMRREGRIKEVKLGKCVRFSSKMLSRAVKEGA